MTAELSVVVAVYNEDPRNLVGILDRLKRAITPLSMPYEVIFVNDGSGHVTSQALQKIAGEVANVKLVALSRNFGQQAAISAGFDHAEGQAIVNIDSDMQDPPELIPEMIRLWRQGYDVVYAQRSTRRDRLGKRLSAFLFYRVLGSMSSVNIPWDTGDFRLMDRRVIAALQSLPEKTRFLRGMIPWLGFRQTGVAIDRDAREFGESTYTLSKLLKLATDGLVSFSVMPLYAVPFAGAALLALGLIGFVTWLIICGISHSGFAISSEGVLLLTVVLAMAGLQTLCMGFMSVYMSRILDEVRARPTYIVGERKGLPFSRAGLETNLNRGASLDLSGLPPQAAAPRSAGPQPSLPGARVQQASFTQAAADSQKAIPSTSETMAAEQTVR